MLEFKSHAGIHTLKTVQRLPVSMEKAWAFFSSPDNLKTITPPQMGFDIVTPFSLPSMFAGQIITFKVSPFRGVRTNWVTEITHVSPMKYFVDEQRFGPYALWHHRHNFVAVPGGVEMVDEVNYKLPFGFLGQWVNRLVVQSRLKHIFSYRYNKLEQLFGKMP